MNFIDVGALALLIVFQQEIRRFLLLLGRNRLVNVRREGLAALLSSSAQQQATLRNSFEAVTNSVKQMSVARTGALIVLSFRGSGLKFYVASGTRVDADVNAKLLISIFNKNSPLHDGAVVIHDNKILAASCILPVSEKA